MTEVYRKATSTDRGGETRAMRGLMLYRHRGDEIVAYLDGTYGVPSRTEEDAIYHVDLDRGDGVCECMDHACRGLVCLHVFCAMLKRAEIRRRAGVRRPARSGSGRRCERRVAA